MIKTIKLTKAASLLIAATMLVAVAVPSLALAQDATTDTTTDRASNVQERVDKLRQEAKDRVQASRENGVEKSAEARQRACEARKASLTALMNRVADRAGDYLVKLDSVNTRVTTFVNENELVVEDYARLTANVEAAQDDATVDVRTLASLNADIDCADPDVASAISAFREAVTAAKESLRQYRVSLSDLIQAVKAAAELAEGTTDATDAGN